MFCPTNTLRNYDGFVKTPKLPLFVIPANPGSGPGQAPESSKFNSLPWSWTPVYIGVTTFYYAVSLMTFCEFIKTDYTT
jgi:hypothetical protein